MSRNVDIGGGVFAALALAIAGGIIAGNLGVMAIEYIIDWWIV